jgi:hypothetical protein
MSKQRTPTWPQVKARLVSLDEKELIKIVGEMYKLNADNKIFLTSRLGLAVAEPQIEHYRRAICHEFNPERGLPKLNVSVARRALNAFRKACTDPAVVADLMLYYVEQGVACTLQYGDINAGFYSSLESAFVEAIQVIRQTGDVEIIEQFRPRLEEIMTDTQGIGWGFHDYLEEVYYNEYPQDACS